MAGVKRCEVVVIGSGPGGCVSACVLAERGRDVILIEEGTHVALERCEPFGVSEIVEKYRCGGLNVALGAPRVAFAQAKCVGGGSEVNGGLYHRTPAETLDLWRRTFRVDHVEEETLESHFAECERALSVSYCPGRTPLAGRKLEQGAARLGWAVREVPRWFAYRDTLQPDGSPMWSRRSMTTTFLSRALAAGCRLLSETRAIRIRWDNGGWQVLLRRLGETSTVRCEAVFVCAGAVQTPVLLRRSGFRHWVGRSLAMQPMVKVAARFDEEVNYPGLGVPPQQVTEFAPELTLGCSVSSPPYLALLMIDHPGYMAAVRTGWRHMAIYYAATMGDPDGRIHLIPGVDDPVVTYGLSDRVLETLARGLRHLCTALLAAGARELYPSIRGLGPLRSQSDLAALPRQLPRDRTTVTSVHLSSSCPMAGDRRLGAASSFGQVYDAQNVVVNDASLLCTAPGVNPQGTVMALAHRNALHFLGEI